MKHHGNFQSNNSNKKPRCDNTCRRQPFFLAHGFHNVLYSVSKTELERSMATSTKSQQIIRLTAGLLGVMCLSVVIAGCINAFGLFDFQVRTPHVAVPLVLLLLLSQVIHKIENSGAASPAGGKKGIVNAYYLILGVLAIALLVSIPFLWWGVIKKVADRKSVV